MNKQTIITVLMTLMTLTASGREKTKEVKTEYGTWMSMEIKDHLTHDKVSGAKAELLLAADSSRVKTLPVGESEQETIVRFHATKPDKYIVCIHAEGYVTAYADLDASKLHKRERFRTLPTVYLRKTPKKNEYELGEVIVRSTRLKFYMDGDTLVYNADAFNMAEGSLLGELISKLPGVEIEEGGVITVNGRPVESMLLNGKDFFDKDRELLLENMPSYMVKSINTYERTPESLKGTEWEKEAQKEYVMDVRLKKDYNTGWIANAEAGGGATFSDNANGQKDGKHLGRLFGLRFTDKSRLVAFVNTNNLNDMKKPGKEGDWAQIKQTAGLTSSISAGMNYGIQQGEGSPKDYKYEGSIDGSYSDKNDERQTSKATFLDDGNTFGKSFSANRAYEWKLNTQHVFRLRHEKAGNYFKNLYVSLAPELSFNQWNNRSGNADVTLSEDVASGLGKAWMDSIVAPDAGHLLKQYAINRTISSKQGSGHHTNLRGSITFAMTPAYNDFLHFNLSITGISYDYASNTYDHYRLEYPTDDTKPMDFRNRYEPYKNKTQQLHINPSMSIRLKRNDKYNQQIHLGYTYDYNRSDNNNPLYLLNRIEGWELPESHPLGMLPSEEEMLAAMDQNNSSHTIHTKYTHTPYISYGRSHYNSTSNSHNMFHVELKMNFAKEQQHYQRGSQMDTLMGRNTSLLESRLFYTFSAPKRGRSINVSYNFSVEAPYMTSLLNLRDDSDPLNINLGNPNLKNTTFHYADVSYRDKFGKTLINARLRSTLTTNSIAYGFIYDRETGIKTTMPQNVNGNWEIRTDGTIDLPLDKHDKFRLKQNADYRYHHNVDLAGTKNDAKAMRSVVGSHYVTERLSLRYRPTSKVELGVSSALTYQHSTGNRESFQTLNVYTFRYGGNAQIELPWNMQFSTDLTLYARRGYSESSMNTNELVWNARLAKRLLKGNLTLMFDGFDLLGNLSNVRRTINAQGRTETFYNVIPSYGLFHAIYRLNKQPKKKK